MKRLLAWVLCLALTAGLLGCTREEKPYVPTGNALDEMTLPSETSEEEAKPQTLVLPYYPDRSLNPFQSTDFTNRTLFSLLYQGLFSVDRNYQAEAVLCSRYTMSEDMKNYVFYPNEKATFSDGTRLTADDVAASLHAAWANDYYKGRFLHVEEIGITVSGGVAIRLNTGYENLPLLLDIPIVKASQVNGVRPLGTGPFEFVSTVGGTSLHRRSNWWTEANMACTADSVELIKAESPSQIRDQFEFYDVGLVCTDPCTGTYADYRCDYELWDCENGMFLYLGSNMNSKVFSNNAVRSALTFAIDREKLASSFYRGFGRAITLPASPQSPWYNEVLAEDYDYEPEKFKTALTSAALTGSEVVLLVNKDDSLRTRAANAIGEMLTEAGLKVTVDAKSSKSYVEAYKDGDYDLHLGQTRLSPNMDLSAFFAPWGGLSYNKMDDAAIYAMCLESLENSGNYFTLFQMVMEDGRLCPILSGGYAVYAERGLMSNLTPSRDNVFYYSLGKPASEAFFKAASEDPIIPKETVPESSEPSEPEE